MAPEFAFNVAHCGHIPVLLISLHPRAASSMDAKSLYWDGAAREVLGDRDFVFGDDDPTTTATHQATSFE